MKYLWLSVCLVSCSAIINTKAPGAAEKALCVTYREFLDVDSAKDVREEWTRKQVLGKIYRHINYYYQSAKDDSNYLYISELIILNCTKSSAIGAFYGTGKGSTSLIKEDSTLSVQILPGFSKIGDTS